MIIEWRPGVIDLVTGEHSPSGTPKLDGSTVGTGSYHDGLTGLADRGSFVAEVDHACRALTEDDSAALFLLELDAFKSINDTWGHETGDVVLVEVARRLRSVVEADVLVARLGGDEFALWIPDCSQAQGEMIAAKVLAAISTPLLVDSGLSVDISIGWVLAQNPTSATSLLTQADIALVGSKRQNGPSHRCFDEELASQQLRNRLLEREIRQALDFGQFVLASQSILRPDGTPVGREVLARWRHPRRGLLEPAEFLDAVSSGGHAIEFDRLVMDMAIEETIRNSHEAPVWMNLMAESLNRDTVRHLDHAVSVLGLDPSRLVLEISENASAESAEARHIIDEIARLGFDVAIDDFGVGFSRLGAMASLPVSYVKIDRQFINSIDTNDAAERICAAIVDLIHAIGADVVGEGIERKEQADMLHNQGCEYLQGFYFERPRVVAPRCDQ